MVRLRDNRQTLINPVELERIDRNQSEIVKTINNVLGNLPVVSQIISAWTLGTGLGDTINWAASDDELASEEKLTSIEKALGVGIGTLNRTYFLRDRSTLIRAIRKHGGCGFYVQLSNASANFYLWYGASATEALMGSMNALYQVVSSKKAVGTYILKDPESDLNNLIERPWT